MLKKRIPTIIGLLLLVVGAISGVMFINQGTDFLPRAAPEYAPQKVKITNLSENGFTVSWITQDPTIGFVKWGETAASLTTTAMDDRDQLAGSSNEYRTHYISIQNLTPAATYFFKLGSQKNQLYDNNGQAFSITIPTTLGTPPPADTAYGTVVTAAETPAEGAIIYLSMDGATPVSAIVKQNGNWAANISTTRTTSLSEYFTYDPATTKIAITVQPATGELTNIVTNTASDQPVPTITIGQSNDFSTTAAPSPAPTTTVEPSTEPSTESSVEPTPLPENKLSLQPLTIAEDRSLTITSIPKDGATVASTKPELAGKAPAATTLTISVHSASAITDQVQTSETGKWTGTPPTDLEPGSHTVSVSYVDAEGILHQTSRDFIVAADLSIQQVDLAYSASPAATIKPTPKPSPSSVPSPTPRSVVATTSADVVAGSTTPTYFFLLIGLVSLVLGSLILKRQ